ncbi:alpha-1-inhibitor 3-like [Panulirus ornatus]|uniref:alpha-1-inhibitor 3-like n=1 Tax=Panulirus ornatus TaxID=150431 RepID=UPI003A8C329B
MVRSLSTKHEGITRTGRMKGKAIIPKAGVIVLKVRSGSQGVVYFGQPTVAKGTSTSTQYRRDLLASTFSQLEQRVIRKYEAKLEEVLVRVLIDEWLQQQDILGNEAKCHAIMCLDNSHRRYYLVTALVPNLYLATVTRYTVATLMNQHHRSYVILTPRQWTSNTPAQVCVFVTDPAAPKGSLTLSLTTRDWQRIEGEQNVTLISNTTIQIPAGKTESCHSVPVPELDYYSGDLHIFGTVGGTEITRTEGINLKRNTETTFLQTDKYLYQPGQNVKFRILTLAGADLLVSNKPYPEVWVTTPSRTRIAQWKNVDNTAGLVHLDFDLADEPEEGIYYVYVKTPDGSTESRSFKVEDFVLPRFEVTVKPPSYIQAIDEEFTFTVCANYTFGQPVKGNLSLTVDNGQRKKCRVEVTRNVTIFGCADVKLTAAEMQVIDCNVYSLTANAIVAEEGTGVELKADGRISITRNPITFKTLYEDRFMKPNLPFSLKLRAQLPDGSPAANVPMEVCAAGRCNNMTTPPDGIFTAVLPSYKTNRVFMKTLNCRANLQHSQYSKTLEHYYSPSNSSLLIQAPEGKIKCVAGKSQEHILPVLFSATNQKSAFVSVQVISRGKVQHTSTKEYQFTSGELPFNVDELVEPLPPPPENTVRGVLNIAVNLPPKTSPKAKVLVWYTREDGEVVSDVRELEVEKCLNNDVSLTWSVAQAQPGAQASLALTSEPNSLCSLGVVDRSSELLSQEPDPITLDQLFSFVNGFNIPRWLNSQIDTHRYCQEEKEKAALRQEASTGIVPVVIRSNYYSDYVDALKMFDDSGMYIFTDLTVETRPCEEEPERYFQVFAVSGGFAGAGGGAAPPSPDIQSSFVDDLDENQREGSAEQVDAPRTNFPETWLWDLVVLPSSGVSNQELTLPDTITQWVGKAVCSHPEKGVGLSDRETIITFTPFFVDLTLPPTVKRGEILPVKMSVFNYLGQSIPVTVTVEESSEYEILEDAAYQGTRGKRSACVPANDKVVQTVRIKPSVIGDVNLTVSAFVDHQFPEACGSGDTSISRRDALIKPIKVEAEGFLREKTWTKYICTKDFETGDDTLESWELATPSGIVEGSERSWVTAVGDLLALSLENLGHLIRMPYGCGEQNMVNFAPNIFIMQYLKASNQTTPESTKKLLNFMKTGYQRELLYRRDNGSYSAFGNADDSGSTWLTAFVLKSFAQARDYILIDEEGLNVTGNWLKSHQQKDGCFPSVGKLLHKGLKGGIAGSDSLVPLTSYVMISLLEAGEAPTSSNVSAAAKCLKADTSQDPYTLALKAYALSLGRLPEGETVLQQLLDQAIVAKNSTYWELPKGPGKSKSVAVETAGYAILAMMAQDPKKYEQQARKVVKWITVQRNGQGGFHSTQDTVVALQAMAVYESHLYQGPLNVVATVTATGLTHPFTVTDDNKLLQQLVTLPTLPTSVSINMEGQGCAVLQAVLRYNIPEAEPNDAFYLTVNTNTAPDSRCVTKRITACAAYRLPDGKSNMAIIQVDLISGYIPEKEDLKKLVKEDPNIKRYEVDGSLVSFYIEELTEEDTCVNFRVIREVDVEDVKAGTVTVSDYYQPEFSVSQRYTLPSPTECR